MPFGKYLLFKFVKDFFALPFYSVSFHCKMGVKKEENPTQDHDSNVISKWSSKYIMETDKCHKFVFCHLFPKSLDMLLALD